MERKVKNTIQVQFIIKIKKLENPRLFIIHHQQQTPLNHKLKVKEKENLISQIRRLILNNQKQRKEV